MSAAALVLAALAAATAPAPAGPAAPTTPPATLPQATPAAVHTRLGQATPRLGEPFEYEIEVRHPRAESYALPQPLALPPFQAEPLGCRRAAAGEETLSTCAVRLRLFELGARDVPTLRLEVATPQGPRVLDVPGPRVEVRGVIDPKAPPEQLTLRDPAPAVPLLLPSWRVLLWALGGLGGLLLAWLGWRALRRRLRAAAEPPPPVLPAERFARRLDALEAERLPEQGRAREFFFRLSEAVREYLGAVSGVNALDLTTGELLEALRAGADARLDLEALRGFCGDCDLVKFARFPAGGPECLAGLGFARDLLARTHPPASAPVPLPPPASPAAAWPGRSA